MLKREAKINALKWEVTGGNVSSLSSSLEKLSVAWSGGAIQEMHREKAEPGDWQRLAGSKYSIIIFSCSRKLCGETKNHYNMAELSVASDTALS